ncbi:hypothetical protein DYY66_2056 [Candidatus Nitrosotalea sp. FS]|uniref:hypothetical protein n=1 Tax=Candidatus Nitrosotalea sp. FS TaxID=2341021 RepID=UPI00140D88E9|nr:hypothetical protein [Candidatus Nitrosotalea sp. FS]NHH98156.1 hypothetical protein [Candidatus Nitrosotalea sp. FS]
MTRFEQELKNNVFVSSFCTRCNKQVWPPSDMCNSCFGNIIWKPVTRIAKLIEFSRKGDEIFGIVEFENNIRVMGRIVTTSALHAGQMLNLIECDYDGKAKFVLAPIV